MRNILRINKQLFQQLCRAAYELMKAMKPNAEFSYQSLDLPFLYCFRKIGDRIFKYKHNLSVKDKKISVNIGDVAQLSSDWYRLALEYPKRDGFLESYSINSQLLDKKYLIPLYKTVEKQIFYSSGPQTFFTRDPLSNTKNFRDKN